MPELPEVEFGRKVAAGVAVGRVVTRVRCARDAIVFDGVTGAAATEIWEKLQGFASFGFPESHSVSFAYLVYASAWIKRYHPAAFCAALLNAQPMGFYSPHSLVQDARRHGVEVHTPDLNASAALATLEWPQDPGARAGGAGTDTR